MDIISSLHDCLIHQILYFLETKESVRTTVLSKGWLNVWKSLSYFDLNASDFNQVQTFINFTNSIFHHKLFSDKNDLDTFILRWFNCNEESHEIINGWINNLVSLKPKDVQIELYLPNLENMYFLSYLFNCVTIESLYLRPEIHDGSASLNPTIVNLPFLQNLQLFWLDLNDEFFQKILLGCPILEELVIESCSLKLTDQKIVSCSLKKLTIRYNEFSEEARLRIWIPGLLNLEIEIPVLGEVSFDNLESIKWARVTILKVKYDYDPKEFKLLKSLSNAKNIALDGFSLPLEIMFEKESSDLPIFEKLEILDFAGPCINKDLQPLASLLKRAPNLEKLFLRHVIMDKEMVFERGRENEMRCEKLKALEIVCWKGYQGANTLIKYLLMNFNIENINIIRIDEDKIQECVDGDP